jgi:thiamine pyrophosphate-dependent acetolactate synthase large subunit-like protein
MIGPDLGELARICGMPFWRVDRSDGLGSAVREALSKSGPCLVEVDMTKIGEYPNYFPFNTRPDI